MSTRVNRRNYINPNKITLKCILPHRCSNESCEQHWPQHELMKHVFVHLDRQSEKCAKCDKGRCQYLYIDEKWRQCSSYYLNEAPFFIALRKRMSTKTLVENQIVTPTITLKKRKFNETIEIEPNVSKSADEQVLEKICELVGELENNWPLHDEENDIEPKPKLQKTMNAVGCKIEVIEPNDDYLSLEFDRLFNQEEEEEFFTFNFE
jgi:hypothetical protein